MRVNAEGPTCHDGSTSCFTPWLWRKILQREAAERPPTPTSRRSLARGTAFLARKVGEEAVETAVASLSESDERVVSRGRRPLVPPA